MRQQVNLYTPELRPRKERIQGTFVVACCLGLVLLMLVAGAWLAYRKHDLRDRLAALEQQNEQQVAALQALNQELQRRQPDPELTAALARVNEALVRRQRLLERVEGLVLQRGGVFSPKMAALARQIPDGVWLTRVRLAANPPTIAIAGRATAAPLVPLYLERLGEAPEFSGRTFGAFRLNRPEAPEERSWVSFFVASEPEPEGDE